MLSLSFPLGSLFLWRHQHKHILVDNTLQAIHCFSSALPISAILSFQSTEKSSGCLSYSFNQNLSVSPVDDLNLLLSLAFLSLWSLLFVNSSVTSFKSDSISFTNFNRSCWTKNLLGPLSTDATCRYFDCSAKVVFS